MIKLKGSTILGRVDNELLHPLNFLTWPCGTLIELRREHVLNALGPNEKQNFLREARTAISNGRIEVDNKLKDVVIAVKSRENRPCTGEQLFHRYMTHYTQ